VADTGSGIPPDVLERIWSPFFTTKPAGQGTGLGLATVKGIVQTHHGVITVNTEVGKGTEFCVYFPATDASLESEQVGETTSEKCGRGECVLVVDDEEANRESLHEILTTHGYRAITACDGAEAVAIVDKPGSDVALVVTDYEMPVLHGEGLTRLIRSHHPTIKILMISGSNRMLDIGCDAKLSKPHSAADLLRAVDQLLHPNPPPGSAVPT
jgi:CheY-like chemotaxis protein